MTFNSKCVVPVNIHTPITEGILAYIPPSGKPFFISKIYLLRRPSPSEFPITFLGVAFDIF